MKNLYVFGALMCLLVLLPGTLKGQTTVQGVIKDAESKAPLPYCNIRIAGTSRGAITNAEGRFSLTMDLVHDSVVISYVGYEQKVIAASRFEKTYTVLLNQKPEMLSGVQIYADSGYLYTVMDRCRKHLSGQRSDRVAKTYFGLETTISDQPAELIECYFNGYLRGVTPEDLRFKNGRIGLAVVGSRVFNSIETSEAICLLNLLEYDGLFPAIPFQYNKKRMNKAFVLTQGRSDEATHHIRFEPRTDPQSHFAGEVWIDKKTNALIKIHLFITNTERHPFLSAWDDSIRNVSMDITEQFILTGQSIVPEYIRLNYSLNYETASSEGRLRLEELPDMARDIHTKSVLYFYDYGTPFILPMFAYDQEYSSDYRKLSMIPYNDFFWRNNQAMLLTESQKLSLGVFAQGGVLVNFREGNYGKDFLKDFGNDTNRYNFPYAFWDVNKRVMLNRGMPQNETWTQEEINKHIPSDLYQLKVQILLDINQAGDSFHCVSYTVFDEVNTFYHLPFQEYTNLFLNLYFDICEIERRKMARVLQSQAFTIEQIDSLYQKTQSDMEAITRKYLKEVQTGKNATMMEEWNIYVLDRLRINNLELFF
jgi:hypothetical protein